MFLRMMSLDVLDVKTICPQDVMLSNGKSHNFNMRLRDFKFVHHSHEVSIVNRVPQKNLTLQFFATAEFYTKAQ